MRKKEGRDEEVAKRFPNDVKEHVLTIVFDSDVHRHLICGKPGDCCGRFEIVTFPGYLVIVGDYGSFTFWRLRDMFEFFGEGQVNLSYWCEKLTAVNKDNGAESFSQDKLRENLLDYMEVNSVKQLSDELIRVYNSESEYDFYLNLSHCDKNYDIWEIGIKDYTYYYIWCCHAIVWAIKEYRKMKKGENNER
jgi:hypothetical protein